jgi:hypothetical protein
MIERLKIKSPLFLMFSKALSKVSFMKGGPQTQTLTISSDFGLI